MADVQISDDEVIRRALEVLDEHVDPDTDAGHLAHLAHVQRHAGFLARAVLQRLGRPYTSADARRVLDARGLPSYVGKTVDEYIDGLHLPDADPAVPKHDALTIRAWLTHEHDQVQRFCSACGHTTTHDRRYGGCLAQGCNCQDGGENAYRVVRRLDAVRPVDTAPILDRSSTDKVTGACDECLHVWSAHLPGHLPESLGGCLACDCRRRAPDASAPAEANR